MVSVQHGRLARERPLADHGATPVKYGTHRSAKPGVVYARCFSRASDYHGHLQSSNIHGDHHNYIASGFELGHCVGLEYNFPMEVSNKREERIASRARSRYRKPTISKVRNARGTYVTNAHRGASIVFVHGLGSNPDTTWCVNAEPRRICWIPEFLAVDLAVDKQGWKMMFWQYNYDSFWIRDSNQYRLAEYGRDLSRELSTMPGKIVLVGHSYGGLVVKKALVLGVNEFGHKSMDQLRGVLFLGTPHRGTAHARYGRLFANGLRLFGSHVDILTPLLYDSNELLDLQSSFDEYYGHLHLAYCYEKRMDHIYLFGRIPLLHLLVVNEASATAGASYSQKYALDSDHYGLNKYRQRDSNYRKVYGIINRMVSGDMNFVAYEHTVLTDAALSSQDKWFGKYHVPFSLKGIPSSRKFVNRPAEMEKMHNVLLPGTQYNRRRILVLHGLGGIGKTQLAVEFVRLHHQAYTAILWLNGANENSLRRSLVDQVSRIYTADTTNEHRGHLNDDEADMIKELMTWLAQPRNTNWLLVLDGLNATVQDIKQYLPSSDHGSILITTTLARLQYLGESLEVRRLDFERAQAIFRSWYKTNYDQTECMRLLTQLDGLPLAIAQAAAYLEVSGVSCRVYLKLYKQRWDELVQLQTTTEESYEDRGGSTIWTTWMISYNSILAEHPHVAHLLLFWSYIDNGDLWFGLFAASGNWDTLSSWIGDIAKDEITFLKAMNVLRSYSLVDAAQSNDSYSVHTVVHLWAFFYQGRTHILQLTAMAVGVVGYAWDPRLQREDMYLQRRLLPHVLACVDKLQLLTLQGLASWDWKQKTIALGAMTSMSTLLQKQDRFIEAENLTVQALELSKEFYGIKGASTCDAITNLANIYSLQNKYDQAETLYMQALQGHQESSGPDHSFTMQALNNLGALYLARGKVAEAEKLISDALQKIAATPSAYDETSLDVIYNMATVFWRQGRFEMAEKLLLEVLKAQDKLLGKGHSMTIKTLSNLGAIYRDQGNLDKAEDMYNRALEGFENSLGPDHTLMLGVVNGLGNLFSDQNKFIEAEHMYTRALEGYRQALGPDHVFTFQVIGNLGALYFDQKDLEKAEKFDVQALQGREKILGPKHPYTLDAIHHLGLVYDRMRRDAEAEQLYMRAVQGFSETQHVSLYMAWNNLGLLYARQSRFQEAQQLLELALQGHQETRGSQHPWTIGTANSLEKLRQKIDKLKNEAKDGKNW